MNTLALIQMHYDPSNYPCPHSLPGTCHIIDIAAMTEGPPTPFAAHKRPQLNWNSSVYPLSEEAQLHAWGQLVEYLARGILQVVDPDTPCIEHPVFVVEKYKFAPGLPQLIRLYSQLDGSLTTHIAKSAFEAVTDA